MYLGLVLGLLFGFLFGILILVGRNEVIIPVIVVVLITILGGIIGIYFDRINYEKYINSYIIKKQVIEESLNNEILSGLEKLELLKQVVELNGEYAEKKTIYNKPIYFYLDRDKINNIEMIKLDKEQK